VWRKRISKESNVHHLMYSCKRYRVPLPQESNFILLSQKNDETSCRTFGIVYSLSGYICWMWIDIILPKNLRTTLLLSTFSRKNIVHFFLLVALPSVHLYIYHFTVVVLVVRIIIITIPQVTLCGLEDFYRESNIVAIKSKL